jgi:hypothetical protein
VSPSVPVLRHHPRSSPSPGSVSTSDDGLLDEAPRPEEERKKPAGKRTAAIQMPFRARKLPYRPRGARSRRRLRFSCEGGGQPVAEAHRALEAGEVIGKAVLTIE